jgi:hypothetical protein
VTRLLVSTVRRHSPPSEASGYLYVVDLEKEALLQRCTIVEPAYKQRESNPRGGMRGSKGISIRPDQIAFANSMMVFRFSPNWDFLGLITHPSCAYIHDILFQEDTLWVASAYSDLLVQFDLSGNVLESIYLRQPSQALNELNWKPPQLFNDRHIYQGSIDFRDPVLHDQITYDNAHVNSMAILENGDILVSLGFIFGDEFAALLRLKVWLIKRKIWPYVLLGNKYARKLLHSQGKNSDDSLVVKPVQAKSAVIRISPDGVRRLSLALSNLDTPSHSLMVLPDQTAVYLNTAESVIIHYEPISGDILSSTPVSPGFLRGVGMLSENTLVIGNKDTLLYYDLETKSVLSKICISKDPLESIYDVKPLPDHFAMPPASFEALVYQATGCKSPEELVLNGSKELD